MTSGATIKPIFGQQPNHRQVASRGAINVQNMHQQKPSESQNSINLFSEAAETYAEGQSSFSQRKVEQPVKSFDTEHGAKFHDVVQ